MVRVIGGAQMAAQSVLTPVLVYKWMNQGVGMDEVFVSGNSVMDGITVLQNMVTRIRLVGRALASSSLANTEDVFASV
ncbi:hypothetical protein Pmani_019714 [Petrolisthes manimaculis]|uniref:Uncharacterized protein n=1 Tax=Petrolisthes manimaculis TaxID=1843537 RepID=A0AAE1PJV6_9EUCA|nr:hypothetical protein Pmani_019714 [Petrolisthes manimaculis]